MALRCLVLALGSIHPLLLPNQESSCAYGSSSACRIKCLQRRTRNNRCVVSVIFIFGKKLTNLCFKQVLQTQDQPAISSLLINTAIRGTPTCRARRMCSFVWGITPSVAATTITAPSICAAPRNHIFNIVGVTRCINMSIVPIRCFILSVSKSDSNTSCFLLWSIIYLVNTFCLC